MSLTKVQFKKIKKLAEKIYKKNNDPFHNFEHALIVSETAVYLAKREKVEMSVCKVAGLLHDLAPKERGVAHGEKSAKIAIKMLNRIKLNKDFINKVALAIKFHDTSKSHLIDTKEGKVIFDADKLQCFGSIGIFRQFGDLLIKGWGSEKAINETLEYIIKYNPRFFTKSARKIKKGLRQFNFKFYKTYHNQQKI